VAAVLARHVAPNARLVLALSGGLDSVVLLHALQALRSRLAFALSAVHVHHGLSPDADSWVDFCTQLCAAQDVALSVHRVQIAPGDPAGIEAAARRERQRIFAAIDADWLLTAHHQDDQAETLVLQLLRGAGPKGLAAMPEVRTRPAWHAAQLRPLLGVARDEIRNYAVAHGLAWVEDASNQEVRFRRNVLRHRVMPVLAEAFPGTAATLARAATLQADAAELLDDLARIDAQTAIAGKRLDCAALATLSRSRARNLLRLFIEQQGQLMPSFRRLDETLHQLLDARQDARVCVRLGASEIRRFRGGAFLVPAMPASVAAVDWHGEPQLTLPGMGELVFQAVVGQGLKRRELENGRVTLGLRQGGERLRLSPAGPTRSLKNLLQERALEPWLRECLPVLTCDGAAVWAATIGCHADWQAAADEPGLLPLWHPASR
jgi:tRNA(Ile)-lysidine synthase